MFSVEVSHPSLAVSVIAICVGENELTKSSVLLFEENLNDRRFFISVSEDVKLNNWLKLVHDRFYEIRVGDSVEFSDGTEMRLIENNDQVSIDDTASIASTVQGDDLTIQHEPITRILKPNDTVILSGDWQPTTEFRRSPGEPPQWDHQDKNDQNKSEEGTRDNMQKEERFLDLNLVHSEVKEESNFTPHSDNEEPLVPTPAFIRSEYPEKRDISEISISQFPSSSSKKSRKTPENQRSSTVPLTCFISTDAALLQPQLEKKGVLCHSNWNKAQIDCFVTTSLKRTVNLLIAISKKLPIYDAYKIIKESEGEESSDLWISDSANEFKYEIKLSIKQVISSNVVVFTDLRFLLLTSRSQLISNIDLKQLIELNGGSVVKKANGNEDVIVIGSEIKKGFTVTSYNFILDSVIRQEILDKHKYTLII